MFDQISADRKSPTAPSSAIGTQFRQVIYMVGPQVCLTDDQSIQISKIQPKTLKPSAFALAENASRIQVGEDLLLVTLTF